VGVVGDKVPLFKDHREEQILRHPALMGWDDVPIAENLSHGLLEMEVIAATCIRFIAFRQTGPLAITHRRSSTVSEKVDQN